MTRHGRWFLPDSPDVIGLLRGQLAITIEGMAAFAAWGSGDREAERTVRDCEHRADAAKSELRDALSSAFVLPMEPEDLFALSRGTDSVLNHAKDLVRESEVMRCPPDAALAEMARLLAQSMEEVDAAVVAFGTGAERPATAADVAVKTVRRVEKVYRRAMPGLLDLEDLREVMARRELYRRALQMAEIVADVAERAIYAAVKER